MSRVSGKDTSLELRLRGALHKRGLRFRKHTDSLPGRPDVVFPNSRVAVFIDGDFWHGYRFPMWRKTLAPFWRNKIGLNRARDLRNFRKLRRSGWRVVRIWEHQIDADLPKCVKKVILAVNR